MHDYMRKRPLIMHKIEILYFYIVDDYKKASFLNYNKLIKLILAPRESWAPFTVAVIACTGSDNYSVRNLVALSRSSHLVRNLNIAWLLIVGAWELLDLLLVFPSCLLPPKQHGHWINGGASYRQRLWSKADLSKELIFPPCGESCPPANCGSHWTFQDTLIYWLPSSSSLLRTTSLALILIMLFFPPIATAASTPYDKGDQDTLLLVKHSFGYSSLIKLRFLFYL